MAALRRQGSLSRSAALIALGTLAVHQLRYLLAYGGGADAAMAHQGHGYLFAALPILVAASVAVLAARLIRAAVRRDASPSRIAPAPAVRAGLFANAIALAFVVQETAEGILFSGHASGLGAAFAAGGWIALPLALVFGALCALLDGGFARLEALVAGPRPAVLLPRAPRRSGGPAAATSPLRSVSPLAFGLARRPPPAPA